MLLFLFLAFRFSLLPCWVVAAVAFERLFA
jgi:hypothetical protein